MDSGSPLRSNRHGLMDRERTRSTPLKKHAFQVRSAGKKPSWRYRVHGLIGKPRAAPACEMKPAPRLGW